MNSYSQDLRERAVKLYITGDYTKKSLSELLSVSYKTLRGWIALYETTGSCKFAQSNKVGRKRLYEDKDAILAYLKLNPDADGKKLHNAPYHKTWTPSHKILLPQDLLAQPIVEIFYNT